MVKSLNHLSAAAIAVLGVIATTTSATCADSEDLGIRQMIVFGDSFSDVGNIFRASNETSPSPEFYYRGRYSNGRNYVDFLGQKFGFDVSTDNVYAWGGATTNNNFIPGVSTFLNDGLVPSVNEQVRSYLEDNNSVKDDAETTLFALFAGYNDYWFYANNETSDLSEAKLQEVAQEVVGNLMESTRELMMEAGAKRLVVMDLPDLNEFPDGVKSSEAIQKAYSYLTPMHNNMLRQEIAQLAKEARDKVDVRIVSLYNLYKSFAEQADCLGLTKVNSACLVDGKVCPDPLGSVYYDDWHSTTLTNLRIANEIVATLTTAAPTGGSKRLRGFFRSP